MNSDDLHLNIDYLGCCGVVLSPEQKAALQTSLVILKDHYKFNRVYFWGKILGLKEDYYIAQGAGQDEIRGRKTLYSKDCIQWGVLPPATKGTRDTAKLAKGRFTGDPSHEFEHVEVRKIGEGEEATEEEETIQIKEEDRLAAAVAEIDEDVSLAPRGAFVKTPLGTVIKNRSFEGLTVTEASKLGSYLHFREARILPTKPLLEKANLDKSLDFLDPIDEDIPKGSWSLQFERGSGLVILRSALWPGFSFYHVPGTAKFGHLYVGTGERNKDLPFML